MLTIAASGRRAWWWVPVTKKVALSRRGCRALRAQASVSACRLCCEWSEAGASLYACEGKRTHTHCEQPPVHSLPWRGRGSCISSTKQARSWVECPSARRCGSEPPKPALLLRSRLARHAQSPSLSLAQAHNAAERPARALPLRDGLLHHAWPQPPLSQPKHRAKAQTQ